LTAIAFAGVAGLAPNFAAAAVFTGVFAEDFEPGCETAITVGCLPAEVVAGFTVGFWCEPEADTALTVTGCAKTAGFCAPVALNVLLVVAVLFGDTLTDLVVGAAEVTFFALVEVP
jgi:hypothetical protein